MPEPNATAQLPPVVKRITVPMVPRAAFERFTAGIATWWPMDTHSVAGEQTAAVIIEPKVGGRFYERARDGSESDWGEITVWEPPGRLVTTWHPGRGPESAQEVEITFAPQETGTLVELTHRHWEAMGEDAADVRGRYDGGWQHVLALFEQAAT
ncbi:MAG TPA: SRPBCC domain-containing protein [Gemmatimonadales bacterium]